jgi:hypothetical protein
MDSKPSPSDSSWMFGTEGEEGLDVAAFFGAIAIEKDQTEARGLLRGAFDDNGQPSPRARDFVDSGEWESNDVVLFRVTEEDVEKVCGARISGSGSSVSVCVSYAARDLGGTMIDGTCATQRHTPQVKEVLKAGWYISTSGNTGSTPRRGVRLSPRIPLGWPISLTTEEALLDPDAPFTLSPGQWRFVFSETNRMTDAATGVTLAPGKGVKEEKGPPTIAELSLAMRAIQRPPQIVIPSATPNQRDTAPLPSDLQGRVDALEASNTSMSSAVTRCEAEVARLAKELHIMHIAMQTGQRSVELLKTAAGDQRVLMDQMLSAFKVNQGGPGTSGPAAGELQVLGNRVQALDDFCRDPTGRVEGIARSVRDLEERFDIGGVKFGRFQFGSMKDLVNFVRRRAPQVDYSLFLDGFSILHSMDWGSVAYDTALSSEHAVAKAAYSNTAQARVATSYRTAYPDVFGSSDDKGRTFGKAMGTYAKWHDRETNGGILYVIREGVKSQHRHTTLSISRELRDPDVRELAKEMLDKSREFVVDLCHFVEEFYAEMSESTAITPEEAWRLTTALIYEVFSELHTARSIVKQAKEAESLLHVWGALKTQEVMQRFVDNQFRDDSALTGILVRHIIRRKNDADGSGAMGRKITTLEGKLVTAQYDIKKKMDKDLVTRELAKKVDR